MSKSAAGPERLAAAERERQAVAMRLAGATFRQIGERLGVTESIAARAVKRAMARSRAAAEEDAAQIIATEVERLDAVLLAIWPQAQKGNLGAVDRVLKIMARRAALLGLDAPTKIAPTNPTGDGSWQPTMTLEEAARILGLLKDDDGDVDA